MKSSVLLLKTFCWALGLTVVGTSISSSPVQARSPHVGHRHHGVHHHGARHTRRHHGRRGNLGFGGLGYSAFYGYGSPYHFNDRRDSVTPPYFSIHPPVYYSHIQPRSYGTSPFAAPPTVDSVFYQQGSPVHPNTASPCGAQEVSLSPNHVVAAPSIERVNPFFNAEIQDKSIVEKESSIEEKGTEPMVVQDKVSSEEKVDISVKKDLPSEVQVVKPEMVKDGEPSEVKVVTTNQEA